VIDPVSYVDFIALMDGATAVLTDSGGVQEETTFLGVPCFTLRATTERPVTISHGTNRLLGLDPAKIAEIRDGVAAVRRPASAPPLWDGNAAPRIAAILAHDLAADTDATSALTRDPEASGSRDHVQGAR
jgi:UDP-N-acetylglucosamine 2-epimerase (non-hydrolysing)